ncbi:nucleoporin NUP35-like [Lineus longissimus]|uniref:nucleoporin NUP35-like n=1 Tax=Lineus longissimus TaxID=88925 RepID=UPI002B4DCCED
MFSPSSGPSSEPMTLGSPAASPVHQASFLPGYLLGDTSAMSPGHQRSLWSSPSGHSPPHGTPGRLSAAQSGGFLQSPRSEAKTRDYSHRTKDKTGAPPVQGLIDQITSPAPVASPFGNAALGKRQLDFSHARTPQFPSDMGRSPAQFSTPGPPPTEMSHSFIGPFGSQQKKQVPSPTQIDPFYTQGESIRPDDELDETWVTIFGFPPAATSFILQQFSQYGNIIKHTIANDGNWMHLHFQSKIQAKKALSKNGKVFGNGIMVGVQPCIDKSVMESDRDNHLHQSMLGTPIQQIGPGESFNTSKSTPMRPLTAAYRAASSDHEVVSQSNTPQKNSSIMSKAMEYMFGW